MCSRTLKDSTAPDGFKAGGDPIGELSPHYIAAPLCLGLGRSLSLSRPITLHQGVSEADQGATPTEKITRILRR
jgi:hypothetical protein